METQASPKPKFRWARLFLIIVLALLFMCIGYVGGNLLQQYLAKKLKAYEDKRREAQNTAAEVEDIEHEEVETSEEDTPKENLLKDGLEEIKEEVEEAVENVTKSVKKTINGAKLPLKKKAT